MDTLGGGNLKIAVYTCVTASYDHILPPAVTDPRISYLCYTDDPALVPGPWKAIALAQNGLSPKDQNRFVKMLPHRLPELSGFDAVLYLDGYIQIVGDAYGLISRAVSQSDSKIFLYEHPLRSCVYDEGIACAQRAHDWIFRIVAQLRRYRREGLPEKFGLYEAGVVLRRDTAEVRALMETWWHEYTNGVKRDQLSLTYSAWKHGMRIHSLGPSDFRYRQEVFRIHDHKITYKRSLLAALRRRVNLAAIGCIREDYLLGSNGRSR